MSLALKKPAPFDEEIQAPGESDRMLAEDVEHDDGLLAVAGPIMAVCYLLFFAIAAVTFFPNGTALFAVVISISFALIYFAIPMLFLRTRAARDRRWLKDEQARSPIVEVWTGPMRRWEAIVQIVSVPAAILMGFALLAIRWGTL